MAVGQGCPQQRLLKNYIGANHLDSRKGISVYARNRDVLDVKEPTGKNDLPGSIFSATVLSLACFPSYSITSLTLQGRLEQHEAGANQICTLFTLTPLSCPIL